MVGVSELAHDHHFVVYLCLKMGFRSISATFILLTEHLGRERFQEEDTCEFEVAGRADAAFLHWPRGRRGQGCGQGLLSRSISQWSVVAVQAHLLKVPDPLKTTLWDRYNISDRKFKNWSKWFIPQTLSPSLSSFSPILWLISLSVYDTKASKVAWRLSQIFPKFEKEKRAESSVRTMYIATHCINCQGYLLTEQEMTLILSPNILVSIREKGQYKHCLQ